MFKKQEKTCEQQGITAIKTTSESHLYSKKKQLHKKLLYFRFSAVIEANKENNNCFIGEKTSNIYTQTPVCNGWYKIPEIFDVSQSSYWEFS